MRCDAMRCDAMRLQDLYSLRCDMMYKLRIAKVTLSLSRVIWLDLLAHLLTYLPTCSLPCCGCADVRVYRLRHCTALPFRCRELTRHSSSSRLSPSASAKSSSSLPTSTSVSDCSAVLLCRFGRVGRRAVTHCTLAARCSVRCNGGFAFARAALARRRACVSGTPSSSPFGTGLRARNAAGLCACACLSLAVVSISIYLVLLYWHVMSLNPVRSLSVDCVVCGGQAAGRTGPLLAESAVHQLVRHGQVQFRPEAGTHGGGELLLSVPVLPPVSVLVLPLELV